MSIVFVSVSVNAGSIISVSVIVSVTEISLLAVDGWGGKLHLVQRGGDWAGPQPAQASPRCTKCNSPPTNGLG